MKMNIPFQTIEMLERNRELSFLLKQYYADYPNLAQHYLMSAVCEGRGAVELRIADLRKWQARVECGQERM